MSAETEIFQGADKTIIVEYNSALDLTLASEIEAIVDSCPQVLKTLTAGEISGVTSSQYTIQFSNSDFEDIAAGEYLFQTRATISDVITQGRFYPNKITLRDSAFITNLITSNDYN